MRAAGQALKRPLPNHILDEKGKGRQLNRWGTVGRYRLKIRSLTWTRGRGAARNEPLDTSRVRLAIGIDDDDHIGRRGREMHSRKVQRKTLPATCLVESFNDLDPDPPPNLGR
jgi:hypothetical protein